MDARQKVRVTTERDGKAVAEYLFPDAEVWVEAVDDGGFRLVVESGVPDDDGVLMYETREVV